MIIYLGTRTIQLHITKKLLVLLGCVLALFFALIWTYNHSYIVVTPNSTEPLNVTLKKQSDGSIKSYDVRSSKKILVNKDEYELTSTSGNESYFTVVKAKGLLASAKVSPILSAENDREFIGSGASSCQYYTGTLMLSYNCDVADKLNLHLPTAGLTPSYISSQLPTQDGTSFFGQIEGILEDGAQIVVVSKVEGDDEEFGYHTAFNITKSSGSITTRPVVVPTVPGGADNPLSIIRGLGPDATYTIDTFAEGHIFYEKYPKKLIYYKNLDLSKPQTIDVPLPKLKDSNVDSSQISTHKDTFVVYYKPAEKGAKSELITVNNGTTNYYQIKKEYDSVAICGESVFCAKTKDELDIYLLENGKLSFKQSLRSVTKYMTFGTQLAVVNDRGVLLYNAQNNSGYYSYTLGGYGFDSISQTAGGYIVTVRGNKTGKVSLYMTTDKKDTSDSIDKKILTLSESQAIEAISPYKNTIIISPAVGGLVYDEQTNTYDYDQRVIESSTKEIEKLISELNIDPAKYTFKNTVGIN